MRIGYLISRFPNLTTTFIYREIQALEAQGFEIDVFAIWRPDISALSPESRKFVDSTFYVFPGSLLQIIKAQILFLLKSPVRYLKTLFFLLLAPGESLKNRRRTLGHFIEAVYLSGEIGKRGIEHIHAHFAVGAASTAMIIARLIGTTFSFTAHNTFFTDRILIRDKIREALFIPVISEFSKDYLRRFVPGETHEDKCHIVRCGISMDAFPPRESRDFHESPCILFVAQLAERKGAPYLVEACDLLTSWQVRFRCIIAGDGPQRDELETMVRKKGLEDLVSLPGAVFQEKVRELLMAADIFTIPCITAQNGDMDGIPVSLMEAMAMEIPTVSTYVSGIPELISNEVSGLLTEEKNAEALADSLQRLIENKDFTRKLGKNARKKIASEFDLEKNAARLASLFKKYLHTG